MDYDKRNRNRNKNIISNSNQQPKSATNKVIINQDIKCNYLLETTTGLVLSNECYKFNCQHLPICEYYIRIRNKESFIDRLMKQESTTVTVRKTETETTTATVFSDSKKKMAKIKAKARERRISNRKRNKYLKQRLETLAEREIVIQVITME